MESAFLNCNPTPSLEVDMLWMVIMIPAFCSGIVLSLVLETTTESGEWYSKNFNQSCLGHYLNSRYMTKKTQMWSNASWPSIFSLCLFLALWMSSHRSLLSRLLTENETKSEVIKSRTLSKIWQVEKFCQRES